LNTGDPGGIIAQVRTVISGSEESVTIRQRVQDGLATFVGSYSVSGAATEDQIIGIALGIYMDWSIRFEGWEGGLFFGFAELFSDTSFAIEDLPSHYIGFFAAANNISTAEVFEMLGGVEGTNAAPPRRGFPPVLLVSTPSPSFVYFAENRIINREFTPLIVSGDGLTRVEWPSVLTISSIDYSSGLWAFQSEQTIYDFGSLFRKPS
jgi:hypothetical protein